MSPFLVPFIRPPTASPNSPTSSTSPASPTSPTSPREDTSHLTRFKHAFSALTSAGRKHDRPILQSLRHEKSFDDLRHYNTHSTFQSRMSNFKTKIRRMNSAPPGAETKGIFSFRALDGRKLRFHRSSTPDGDRYILANSQTIANDSTDQKLIRMFISDSSPRASISSSKKRRSSFGSATSNNSRNLLSVGASAAAAAAAPRLHRRYSMTSSELTVASEDLTSREFAEHCGISVYPEDEDEDGELFASGISILVQQHRLSNAPPQSTVMSSTRSTKSKISFMEDTFWAPLSNDFEDPMSRMSDDTEAYTTRSEGGIRERRNSLITFAEAPNMAKHKLQGQGPLTKQGIRSGRHSAPIPIPKPILMQQQSSALQYCTSPSQIDSLSNSSHSTDSSLALSYSSFTSHSTASSVSVCGPSAISIFPRGPPSPTQEKTCSFESPILAAIMSERQSTDPERAPIVVKKGRFEVTIGNTPAPDFSRSTLECCEVLSSTNLTEEKYVVFQRRKYRPESPSSDGEGCIARRSLDERRRSDDQVECL